MRRVRFRSVFLRVILFVGILLLVYVSFFHSSDDSNDNNKHFVQPNDLGNQHLPRENNDDLHKPVDNNRNFDNQHPNENILDNENKIPAVDNNIQINEPNFPPIEDEHREDDKNAKKDWHDYKKIAEEAMRKGPGEQGSAVMLSSQEASSSLKSSLYSQNGFNALVSDKISLERSLNDIRHPDCKKKKYLENLPKVSIIIPFHDEHFSTLLRSVYSILNRTPPELLGEIILVDDSSSKDFLGKKLDDYVKENFKEDLVKIVRNAKREGLIRTRMAGARKAKYEILIFFDSHIECNVNWLPPLIEPIVENYTTSVCPFIDVINEDTFAYTAQDNGARGAFDWALFYKRIPLIDEDKRAPTDPFDSPVMAGGLFAISAKWFNELGGYDEGLEIWGGEQYELSFKIWQCGGKLVDAPCSRVGHIYRKFNPFSSHIGVGDYLSKNYKRVAEIWMDEYKEYIYKKHPTMRSIDAGDISKQLKIREDLKCKSFKWFMTNVAFDLEQYYPAVPPEPYAQGEIRNVESKLCVDTKFKPSHSNFGLDLCQSSNKDISGEQKFELSWRRDIRPKTRNVCWDVSQSNQGTPVLLFECHGYKGNQEFRYNLKTLQIYHPVSRLCLDANQERKEIFMNICNSSSDSQKWQFDSHNATAIEHDFQF